ncbi:hypothetical protein HYC85_031183 [Camellia sinensis]|uniref:Uncharacterized protein n=1 Tax=Camellia sinensis TaxID=4442 RepID=A0A7J7FPZ7_CAMSI|nr:hypothetical protein HYC85_031183 [Camellia sinensis]
MKSVLKLYLVLIEREREPVNQRRPSMEFETWIPLKRGRSRFRVSIGAFYDLFMISDLRMKTPYVDLCRSEI